MNEEVRAWLGVPYAEPPVGRYRQSHNIKVAPGDIFMEQKMRFGLVLGRLAMLKKMEPIMSNF